MFVSSALIVSRREWNFCGRGLHEDRKYNINTIEEEKEQTRNEFRRTEEKRGGG
jgi:hypothetical protein